MKTRFEINEEVFGQDMTLTEAYEYFEKYLKRYGFTLDKEDETVFKEFDREILLNVGDRVKLEGASAGLITYKYYDIDNDLMTYSLEEE